MIWLMLEKPRVALCQDCGTMIEIERLLPDDADIDPPGRCPECGGQTCDCDACVPQAVWVEEF